MEGNNWGGAILRRVPLPSFNRRWRGYSLKNSKKWISKVIWWWTSALALSPTYLQSHIGPVVEDYELKSG